jgi:glycosyltransferase involved in cell wall biosynthesis
MPVWNCEKTVGEAIESVINQDFLDWELLISDNASTDRTLEICNEYSIKDGRIKVVAQNRNIGGWANFLFVSKGLKSKYFKFHAGDDSISPNFLSESVAALEGDNSLSGVCAVDFWDYEAQDPSARRTFAIVGSTSNRLEQLTINCWKSNGVFYGVYRSSLINEIVTQDFIDSDIQILDWLFLAIIANRGGILRSVKSFIQLGSFGASNSGDDRWFSQNKGFRKFFPYYGFTQIYRRHAVDKSLTLQFSVRLWITALYLNHYKGLVRLLIKRITRI